MGWLDKYEDGGVIKQTPNKVNQFLSNLAGEWDEHKPALMKHFPITDTFVGPILNYISGKGGEEAGLAILPIPIKNSNIIKNSGNSEKVYRRLTEGQMNKVIREKGKITPTKSEKVLTATKSFPKKGTYILEVSTDKISSLPNTNIKGHSSPKFKIDEDIDLLSGNHKLYKRVNGKLYKVDPKLYGQADKKGLIDRQVVNSMLPATGNFSNLHSGEEFIISPHKIVISGQKPQLSLNNDYLYNVNQFYKEYPRSNHSLTNSDNYYEGFKNTWRDYSYYPSINPSKSKSNELTKSIKNYIKDFNSNINPKFQDIVTINSARNYYKNHFNQDITSLSNDDISKFIQKSFNESGADDVLFHSTDLPIFKLDNSLIGKNTGNKGWFGEGLYFSDTPSQGYGLLQEPFIHKGLDKKVLINNIATLDKIGFPNGLATTRFTSPQKEVDKLLNKISPIKTYVDKNRKFEFSPSSVAFGVSDHADEWNKFLRNNNVDAVFSNSTTKISGGVFPEIVIPPHSQHKIRSIFPSPELISKSKLGINRDWGNVDINYKDGGTIPKAKNGRTQREYERKYNEWLVNKRRREASEWARENVTKGTDEFAKDYVWPAIKAAGSFSPMGPVIGLSDAYNAYKQGDNTGAIIGAGLEALPYGINKIGKYIPVNNIKIGNIEILPIPKQTAHYRNVGGKEGYLDILSRREIAPPIIPRHESTGLRSLDGSFRLPKKQFNRAFYARKGEFSPALRYKGPYAVEADFPMRSGFGGNWGFAPDPKTGYTNLPLDIPEVRLLKQYRLPKTEKVLFQKELSKVEKKYKSGGTIKNSNQLSNFTKPTVDGWLSKYE